MSKLDVEIAEILLAARDIPDDYKLQYLSLLGARVKALMLDQLTFTPGMTSPEAALAIIAERIQSL